MGIMLMSWREGDEGWRIERRQLVFLGPGMVGNASIVGS